MFSLHHNDCRKILPTIADSTIDSICCDPPYHLMNPAGGFLSHSWDGTGIAHSVEMWRECLRVLKPGGHLLAFSSARTYHRMACAIEDAGFQIRDQLMCIFSSGFCKSLNIAKAIDETSGVDLFRLGTWLRDLRKLKGIASNDLSALFVKIVVTLFKQPALLLYSPDVPD